MRLNSHPHLGALGVAFMSLLVLGCAGRPVPHPVAETAGVEQAVRPGDEEPQEVRQRAAEYWDARVKRDYCRQLKLSEPRLQGRVTCEEYARGKGAIEYLGYDVGDADIKGSFARVQVKVVARITLPGSRANPVVKTATVPDAWIKVESVWYRRVDQGEGSPAMSGAVQ